MTDQRSTRVPQFFLTPGGPCPYLPGKTERKVFARLGGNLAQPLSEALTHSGFRRSQSIAYRPACEGCSACVSVRIRGGEFAPSRSQKRILRRGQRPGARGSGGGSDARTIRAAAHLSGFAPSRRRHERHGPVRLCRHGRGDAGQHPYRGISPTGPTATGPLVACALTDRLRDGLSMVYSFFHPGEDARSLGTYMILDHVRTRAERGLRHVYLGYWVRGSEKMDYKTRFSPLEALAAKAGSGFKSDSPPSLKGRVGPFNPSTTPRAA